MGDSRSVADPDATLRRFAELVAASPHNLVSRRARAELWSRHVPECTALAALLPSGNGRLLDIGSGGGFPGMVIAIVRPQLEVHLLDSTHKKTRFLADAARQLELAHVVVHTGRAEELARPPLAGSFDLVTARAVAPLASLVPLAAPFLAPGGVLYAVKGERWREELDEATPALARTGTRLLATPEEMVVPSSRPNPAVLPRVVMIGRSR